MAILNCALASSRKACGEIGDERGVGLCAKRAALDDGGHSTVDIVALRKWLAEPRAPLIAAVAEGVREHLAALRSRGIDFYGYALLPGDHYDIHRLVAVTNTEASIKVPRSDDQYRYYRYGVDEWAHWYHDGFSVANALLAKANERFKSMHSKADDDYMMDEFEIAHADALLDSVVRGLQAAREGGVFGYIDPFLVVWISDSEHEIMAESVLRLNSAAVAGEFMREFG